MGTNARTTAILAVFKQVCSCTVLWYLRFNCKVVEDYVTPPNKHISRDLDSKLKPMIQFLIDCRPFSLGMGNVVKYMKYHVSLTVDMSEGEVLVRLSLHRLTLGTGQGLYNRQTRFVSSRKNCHGF